MTPAELAEMESRVGRRVAGPTVVGGVVVTTIVLPPASHRPGGASETRVEDLRGRELGCWRWPAGEALERHAAVVAEYRGETAEGVTP